MITIAASDAQGLYTKAVVDVFKERATPTGFLRSFFKTKETTTLELSIEVQRGFEFVAQDVIRGTEGNRNTFGKTSEKLFIPPYHREYYDITSLQSYDRLFTGGDISDSLFADMVNDSADKMLQLREKIERAHELQCAQIFENGTATFVNAGYIDFKRKAASMVNKGAGNYWATGSVSPFDDLEDGCVFLRTKAKAQGERFNAIFGSDALADMLTNTTFLARQNVWAMRLDAIAPPQRNSVGAVYHGSLTCGAYLVDCWSYPEYYDTKSGNTITSNPYVNPKKVVMLPSAPRFTFGFAAVPQLIGAGMKPIKGAFIINEYKSERNAEHILDIQSAGLAIPTQVDAIYTVQVKA